MKNTDSPVTLTIARHVLWHFGDHILGQQLDTFTDRFLGELYPGESFKHAIDWPAVASSFDGIVIAPYIWTRRLNLMWYYGWDVASGCIWNLDAIERLEITQKAAVR